MTDPKVGAVKTGVPKPKAVYHQSVAALIQQRKDAQEAFAAMDDAPEAASAAVSAELDSIDAQLTASAAWHAAQEAEAAAFRKECVEAGVKKAGFKVDASGNVHI